MLSEQNRELCFALEASGGNAAFPRITLLSREDADDSGLKPVKLEGVQVLTCLAVNMTCRQGLTSIFTWQNVEKILLKVQLKNRIVDH